MGYLILLAVNILCVFICHYIATERGIKPVFWGVMAAVFGPFAIPFVLMSKPKTELPEQN